MKIFLLLVLTLYILPSPAALEIGLHFDRHGKLIHPDEILLQRGIDADKAGFQESATKKYKRSAEFGNKRAKYIIAMRYFQNKDWINGYAWLRLLNGNYKESKTMIKNIESLITETELKSSNKVYQELKPKYSAIAALERREKWDKSIKLTGSHVSGIRDVAFLRIVTNSGISVSGNSLFKEVERFKYEYEEIKTEIEMGDIVPVGD